MSPSWDRERRLAGVESTPRARERVVFRLRPVSRRSALAWRIAWLFSLKAVVAQVRPNPARNRSSGGPLHVDLYYAGAAVHGDDLSVAKAGGGVCGGDHGGDGVLAGDQGGVGGEGAPVGDHRGGLGEQRGPGGGGGAGDQDLSLLEAGEVARVEDDPDRAGGPPRAGRVADQGSVRGGGPGARGLDRLRVDPGAGGPRLAQL